MSLGKHLGFAYLAGWTLLFASCAGGGSSGGSSLNSIGSAVQDLAQDPEGATTVLSFGSSMGLAGATVANFEADGGQTAQSVLVNGNDVTVSWDLRVAPSHQVRAVGLVDVSESLHAVTTSNSAAPTFTITQGTQNPGLGGDTIQVAFAGTHVVRSTAETLANWHLSIDSTNLDLLGSTFIFDPLSQVLDITLGTQANLHATYQLSASGVSSVGDVAVSGTPVNGTATGDTFAPALTSAEQNLSEDEYGRVIDFTFDEAMDPVFSLQISHFGVALPDVATTVEQPSENVLRVTFSGPIVPGVEEVTLDGVTDLHGNAFPDGAQAITQPAPVANAFDGTPTAETLANAGNDVITVVTTQAFDADSAVDPTKWSLVVGGNTIDLSTQTFDYDFLAKKLAITLDLDMQNGDAFTITGVNTLDIDGDTFSLASNGTVAGDSAAPTATAVTQNRSLDPSGKTVDVTLSEDVDETTAETAGNWTISGAQSLLSATRLPGLDQVRLAFDAAVIPGFATLTVSSIEDLAGNAMAAPQVNIAITSTDTTRPSGSVATATAVEGVHNDKLAVTFNDDMIESEVETAAGWTVESPVGSARSTAGATISYDAASQTATLTFANGVDLQRGDDFSVAFAGMHDLGGNLVTTAVVSGDVSAETTIPDVHTVYRDATNTDQLVVRFTEPCSQLADLYDAATNPSGTRYILRSSGGALRGYATGATALDDGLGVRVAFGIVVASDDTLDVHGVKDLAGNPLFPALSVSTVAEDTSTPALDPGLSVLTAVSGEGNDVITVKFDRAMSPWNLLAPANYTVTAGATPVDLSIASFDFDGTDTVTIGLVGGNGNDLSTGGSYDISVNNVGSAQGAQRTSVDTDSGLVAGGDATAPSLLVGKARIDPNAADSVLLELTEAVDATAAETAANYDYNGGNLATSALLLGPRVVRVTFAVTPVAGNNLQFTVTDLAGNLSGTITRAVTAADVSGPLVSSVQGLIRPGYGGDSVAITFNEPVTGTSALDAANYSVRTGSTTLSLAGASLTYSSSTHTVEIRLPAGGELLAGASLSVTLDNVADFSGNAMAAPVQISGPVSGDSTSPSFESAFVNYREAANGRTVDVLFSEDVSTAFAGSAANWSASGGVSVQSVTMLEKNHARLSLSAALGASATLSMTGLSDYAGNTSGPISVDPLE